MKFLIYTHILAGILSLVVAPVAMVVRKGGDAHRVWGKVFFWAMAWICLSAVIISVYQWMPFFLLLALLSFYAAFTGYRTLYQKQLHLGRGVRWYDWAAAVIAGICMVGFVVYGIYLTVYGRSGFFNWLAIGFGVGGCLVVWGELKSFISPPANKHYWLFNHIGSMVGGFTASVSAFSVQTMHFLPGVMPWIWPALVGTPLIILWSRYYRKKLKEGAPVSSLVQLTLRNEGK